MKPGFWEQRWCGNRIGFHQDKPNPLMLKHCPQHEKDGLSLPVAEDEVRALYGHGRTIEVQERRDILDAQPGFVAEGVTRLATAAYRLERNPG